jgi:hypothetical protein
MTPKEKAKELYDKMFLIIENKGMYDDLYNAKQCALIVADEILKAVDNQDETYLMKHSVNYWAEVKQEIEKL